MTTRFLLKFSLLTLHLGSATLWLGAMTYSLFVLQPRLGKLLKDPEKIESVHRVLAVGNRWPVIGLIGVLGGSGFALLLTDSVPLQPLQWVVLLTKTVLMMVALSVFAWISWHAWPSRLFALPEELPRTQRRFRRFAMILVALAAGAYVLGILLRSLRTYSG